MMEPQSNVSAPPHAPPRGDAVMVMFERFILFVLLYTVLAPAVPWIFAWKRGTLGVWSSTVIALLLLVLLHALALACLRRRELRPGCGNSRCSLGRGRSVRPSHPNRGCAHGSFSKVIDC
jgi:hypothetical protein